MSSRELEALAQTLGRSNYLVGAIPAALRHKDFTNADRLAKQFPGSIDEIQPFGQPMLHQAIQTGDEPQLEFLLAHGAHPNGSGRNRDTPLCQAIQMRRWQAAIQLLDAGASAMLTNPWGQTPLGLAVNNSWGFGFGGFGGAPAASRDNSLFAELIEKLLDKGADPFARSGPDATGSVLDETLNRQFSALSGLFLTNRPSPSRRTPTGQTALHLAVLWGRTNVIDSLLTAGFSADQTNSDGLTPLQMIADEMWNRAPQVRFAPRAFPIGGPPQSVMGQPGPAANSVVADFLLSRGAKLDVLCAAGLGRTNELEAMLKEKPELAETRDGIGRTPLHYAAGSQQLEAAKLLVNARAPLSLHGMASVPTTKPLAARPQQAPLPVGTTLLHIAAQRGDADLTRLLLTAGADVTQQDADGNTALHASARGWQTNCLMVLLNAHSPLEATNHRGETPLAAAVTSGSTLGVECLLNAGAQTTSVADGEPLLHLAAQNGSIDILKLLLRRGLTVDSRDAKGQTAFQRAVATRQWNALDFLHSKGADINAADLQVDTSLHKAVAEQYDEVMQVIQPPFWDRWKQGWLARGGMRQQTMTKLMQWKVLAPPASATWTNRSVTTWLLEQGAKPNLTNHLGQTPLYALLQQSWLQFDQGAATNRIRALLQAGARLDIPDLQGATALHTGATNASGADLSFLLDAAKRTPAGSKWPPQLKDKAGLTPVHYAALHCLLESNPSFIPPRITALITGGLDPNARDALGQTPLHYVVRLETNGVWSSHVETLMALLTNGADPNLVDKTGASPLHTAVREWAANPTLRYNASQNILTLLTNGANPNLRDPQGRTPLHLIASTTNALEYGSSWFEEVLRFHGWDFGTRDNSGEAPIHGMAAWEWNSYRKEFRSVLSNKVVINLTNAAGDTPLLIAIRNGRDRTAQMLMEAGADASLRNAKGESAWLLAARANPAGVIAQHVKPTGAAQGFFHSISMREKKSFNRWLEAEPRVCSVTNVEGQTPLLEATERRENEFAERLLELGAPLDVLSALRLNRMKEFRELLNAQSGPVPGYWLFEAVRFDRLKGLQALVEAGGDLHAVDDEGHSLLYRASFLKKTAVSDWLREKQCAESIFDAVSRGDVATVSNFLASASAVDTTNHQGRTLLLQAAGAAKPEIVALLLGHGAKATNQTRENWNGLHFAAAANDLETGKLLLQAGADPNQFGANGIAPLHVAAAFGNTGFCTLLLDHGADVNLQPVGGSFGNTALHWAAHRGSAETVKLLLARGADTKALNTYRSTPAEVVGKGNRGFWMSFFGPPEAAGVTRRMPDEVEQAAIRRAFEEAASKETPETQSSKTNPPRQSASAAGTNAKQ
jgi:ankyrin repeat protein